jgi:hypothetical protein
MKIPRGINVWGTVTRKRSGQLGVKIAQDVHTRKVVQTGRLRGLEPGDPVPLKVSYVASTGINLTVLRISDLEKEDFLPAEVVRFSSRRRVRFGRSVVDGERKVLPPWFRLIEERNVDQLLTIDSGVKDWKDRPIVFTVGFLPVAYKIQQLILNRTVIDGGRIVSGSTHRFVEARTPMVVDDGSYLLNFVNFAAPLLSKSDLRNTKFVLNDIFRCYEENSISVLINYMGRSPLRAERGN